MKTIIYTCPYVPAERTAAHGLRPSRIIPDAAEATGTLGRAEGVCPFVQGFINEVITNKRAGGIVVTTVCDQMRRAFDILVRRSDVPVFLMNVPNTWRASAYKSCILMSSNGSATAFVTLRNPVPVTFSKKRTSVCVPESGSMPRQVRFN